MVLHRFPPGFLWGVATSAAQIEGGAREGGRGESIWDRYATAVGNVSDGSTPERTCDHYHRWPDDIACMRWLGVGAYRFSTSWSRVMPDGRQPSVAGLDFYERLVDGLLAAGLTPYLTLDHWDLPQALQVLGGWARRDTVGRFVDYTAAVAERLGDRVGFWVTHNEPWCVAILGHELGVHAPGLQEPAIALRVAHHLLLSHGVATGVVRELVPGAEVGIVLNLTPTMPASDTEADRDAARQYDGFFNRWYLDPLYRGTYPADAIADRVARGHLPDGELPFVRDGDLARIRSRTDFLGVNYYSRAVVCADAGGRPRAQAPVPPEELTEMGWEVYPDGLTDILVRLAREYEVPALDVTENGAAFVDPPVTDGRIADPRRVAYFRDHLAAVARAIDAGAPVRSYFAWSLIDNWEWQYGFTRRFGLFAVDFDTLTRTPKDSAHWYREAVASGVVVID